MRTMHIVVLVLLATTLASSQSAEPPAAGKKIGRIAEKGTTATEQTGVASLGPARFNYEKIYCTPDGNSHFATVTVELRRVNFAPPAAPLYIGGQLPASSAFFGGFEPGWGAEDLERRLYHPAPAGQFLIVLKGHFSMTTTDGDSRQFVPGDVIRLEDTHPCTGHITVVGDTDGFFFFAR
jgi:hypothetical protein